MARKFLYLLVASVLFFGTTGSGGFQSSCIPVTDPFTFSNLQWNVRSTSGGPGSNSKWDPQNVCMDSNGWLHLKISRKHNGLWSSAQVSTVEKYGFGKYELFVIGQVDKLDKNVTLGMFNYAGGEDCTNEIDIELGNLGSSRNGHFTVYPATSCPNCSITCANLLTGRTCSNCANAGNKYCTQPYSFSLSGTYTTQRFTWNSKSVYFQSLNGHRTDNGHQIASTKYVPLTNAVKYIPQSPMPFYINYWVANGKIGPSDGETVPPEIIIKSFTYTSDDTSSSRSPTSLPGSAGGDDPEQMEKER